MERCTRSSGGDPDADERRDRCGLPARCRRRSLLSRLVGLADPPWRHRRDRRALRAAAGRRMSVSRRPAATATMAASPRWWARAWDSDFFYRFRRSPIAIGATVVALLCLVGAFGAGWI